MSFSGCGGQQTTGKMKTKMKNLIFICIILLLQGFTDSALAAPAVSNSGGQSGGITIQLEYIEVGHSYLISLLFNKDFQSDSGALRKQIQEKVTSGEAGIIDTVIIRTKDRVRTNTVSVNEVRYPKSYDETGTADFETQNTGISVRVDPTIAEDGATILLSMGLEFCEKIGDADYGNNANGVRVIQPLFRKSRMETSLSVTDGAYVFVGTTRLHRQYGEKRTDPIVMVFARAMINRSDVTK